MGPLGGRAADRINRVLAPLMKPDENVEAMDVTYRGDDSRIRLDLAATARALYVSVYFSQPLQVARYPYEEPDRVEWFGDGGGARTRHLFLIYKLDGTVLNTTIRGPSLGLPKYVQGRMAEIDERRAGSA